jgi:hypothetical protein
MLSWWLLPSREPIEEFNSGSWEPGRSAATPPACSRQSGGQMPCGRPPTVTCRMAVRSQPFRPPSEKLSTCCCSWGSAVAAGAPTDPTEEAADPAAWSAVAAGWREEKESWLLSCGFSWNISSLQQVQLHEEKLQHNKALLAKNWEQFYLFLKRQCNQNCVSERVHWHVWPWSGFRVFCSLLPRYNFFILFAISRNWEEINTLESNNEEFTVRTVGAKFITTSLIGPFLNPADFLGWIFKI